jgi:hypothetical protein
VLLEESLLVLYRVVSNTNSCCIIGKISILKARHVVLIVAASIAMYPVQIYLNSWRLFLVSRRLSRVACGSFNLAFEWLDCHELIGFNLKVIVKLVCFLIFLKCFLFLQLSFLFGLLLLGARKIHSSVV